MSWRDLLGGEERKWVWTWCHGGPPIARGYCSDVVKWAWPRNLASTWAACRVPLSASVDHRYLLLAGGRRLPPQGSNKLSRWPSVAVCTLELRIPEIPNLHVAGHNVRGHIFLCIKNWSGGKDVAVVKLLRNVRDVRQARTQEYLLCAEHSVLCVLLYFVFPSGRPRNNIR